MSFLAHSLVYQLTIMHQDGGKKRKGGFEGSLLFSSAEDNLNLALRNYLHGFANGMEHEGCDDRTYARSTKDALQSKGTLRPDDLRHYIGDLLKARVQMRKATQLQRKKKEVFESAKDRLESARNLLEPARDPVQGEVIRNGQSKWIKRTPWQLLLHKGAPGSSLTAEFEGHDSAQLVPLSLLRLMSKMTDTWKRAHRDIVKGVSILRLSPVLVTLL